MKLHPSPGRSAALSALYLAVVGPLSSPDKPASNATVEEMARQIKRPVEVIPGLLQDLIDRDLLWQTRRAPESGVEVLSHAIAGEPGAAEYVIAESFEYMVDVKRNTLAGLLAAGWDHLEAEAEIVRFEEGPEFQNMYQAIDTFVDYCVQNGYK